MIKLSVEGVVPSKFDKLIQDYAQLIERLMPAVAAPEMFVSWEDDILTIQAFLDSRNPNDNWLQRTFRFDGDGMTLAGERIPTLGNDVLVIESKYRGRNIAYQVNKLGADSLLAMNGHLIELTAGYDVGGYKWLRDGFWPVKGKRQLDEFASKSKAEPWLVKEWLKMTESEAQEAMLHPVLGAKYRQLFAGAPTYEMVADVSNTRTYAAVTGLGRKSANELISAQIIKRQQELEAAGNTLAIELNNILGGTEEIIIAKIQKFVKRNANKSWEWGRLDALREAIYKVRTKGWDKVGEELNARAIQLAYGEVSSLADEVQRLLPVQVNVVIPSARIMKAIVRDRPFHGLLLKEWSDKLKSDDLRRLQSSVQTAITGGLTTDSAVRNLFGTSALGYKDSVTELTKQQVRTVVRTAVHHTASASREQFIQDNKELVKNEMYVATLDSRTSLVCKAWDGKIFPAGEGPKPPLHFNCRSARVFYFDGLELARRPANPVLQSELLRQFSELNKIETVKKRDDLPRGMKLDFDKWAAKQKRKLIGQTPANKTYNDWLKDQTVAFQNETLGKDKALLFRKGELSLSKFVDKAGSPLTLDELYAKYPDAFKLAGLQR